jgi:hypothetical protein
MNTSFEIITLANVCVRTFGEADHAREFVMKHKADLPGLRIEQVDVVTVRTAIYTPRKRVAA